MKTRPNTVLVRILEADRKALFEKPIRLPNGETAYMTIDDMEEKGVDRSFAQTVSVGVVIAVGAGVEGVQVGDHAIMDYIVDLTEEILVTRDRKGKVVCMTTETKFRKEDRIIDANRRTPKPTVDYLKGDLEEAPLLIAVVRDGVIHCMKPYTILKHIPYSVKYKEDDSPIWSFQEVTEVVHRNVKFVFDGSEHKPEEMVLCENSSIFERSMNGQPFDIIFDFDILATINLSV